MQSSRHPRFRRVAAIAPIQLTRRDHKIIRLVHAHRFLRSSHITALVDGSFQQVLRRLQLLYHHGYLERPRAQIDSYHKSGSRQIVYGLGNKSVKLLKREPVASIREVFWGAKNRGVGRIFLEHALLVSDVMVAIELACRKRGTRLLTERDLLPPGNTKSFAWYVKLKGGVKLGVVPDRVFAFEFPDAGGKPERRYFFLEADRGTMPVVRRQLFQTSFFRKLIAYESTWLKGIHRIRFGFHRFRVLTITTIPGRVKSLVEACARLKSGHGLFLFADRTILESPDIFTALWQGGRPGQSGRILD